MNKSYEEYVAKYKKNFTRVFIEQKKNDDITQFVPKLVEAKATEFHHQADPNKEIKRFTTGFLGEAAVEQLLNVSIIDWTIGKSNFYHHPDIPGYNVGIKTVEYNKFPIIFKDNRYPQIICIHSTEIDRLVFVCGLATVDVLNTYQDDNLIIDSKLRARGTKTGFYGFDKLIQVNTLDDLQKFKK